MDDWALAAFDAAWARFLDTHVYRGEHLPDAPSMPAALAAALFDASADSARYGSPDRPRLARLRRLRGPDVDLLRVELGSRAMRPSGGSAPIDGAELLRLPSVRRTLRAAYRAAFGRRARDGVTVYFRSQDGAGRRRVDLRVAVRAGDDAEPRAPDGGDLGVP